MVSILALRTTRLSPTRRKLTLLVYSPTAVKELVSDANFDCTDEGIVRVLSLILTRALQLTPPPIFLRLPCE